MRTRGHGTAPSARGVAVGVGTGYALALVAHTAGRPLAGHRLGLLQLVDDFEPWGYAAVPAVLLAGLRLRSKTLGLAGLAAAATFGAAWGHRWIPRAPAPPADGSLLTVMTYNVLAYNRRPAAAAAVIAAEDPDVVALQEVSPVAAEALAVALDRRYPYRAFQPVASPSGAGILSRYPLRDTRAFRFLSAGHWNQRAIVEAPDNAFTLFNVHPTIPCLVWTRRRVGPLRLPVDLDTSRRSVEVRRLVELVDAVEGPLLVLGDFNLTERSPEYRLLRSRLADAYRAVGLGLGHTFPCLGTFPRALPAPWPVLRLDYVWHSPEFRPLSARLGRSGGSDHHPVVVRLAREAPFPRRATAGYPQGIRRAGGDDGAVTRGGAQRRAAAVGRAGPGGGEPA